MAFDVATGHQSMDVEVFRIKNLELLNAKNSHASPTPIVEGDRVYVHFGAQGTAALSTAGDDLWKSAPYESQHGNGGSPVLYGDLLIFNCDGFDEAFVVALDKQTGKIRWKTLAAAALVAGVSTPLVIRVGDRDPVVSVGAFHARGVRSAERPGNLAGRATRRGSRTCRGRCMATGWSSSRPGFSSRRCSRFAPTARATSPGRHIAWTLQRGAPLTPSPLLVGDDLYVVNDARHRVVHRCADGFDPVAAPVGRARSRPRRSYADGRVYFLDEEGRTTVDHSRADVSAGCDQQARRGCARIDGRAVAIILHPHGHAPVSDWQSAIGHRPSALTAYK